MKESDPVIRKLRAADNYRVIFFCRKAEEYNKSTTEEQEKQEKEKQQKRNATKSNRNVKEKGASDDASGEKVTQKCTRAERQILCWEKERQNFALPSQRQHNRRRRRCRGVLRGMLRECEWIQKEERRNANRKNQKNRSMEI